MIIIIIITLNINLLYINDVSEDEEHDCNTK